MKSTIEDFRTGWYGVHIRVNEGDIDKLIEYLQLLKEDESGHFHLFSTAFDTELGGIADIQFTRRDPSEKSNMDIGG